MNNKIFINFWVMIKHDQGLWAEKLQLISMEQKVDWAINTFQPKKTNEIICTHEISHAIII